MSTICLLQAKEIETSLDRTNRELEAFQWEKLHKLNELDVVVPLRLHQVIQDAVHPHLQSSLCTTKQRCYCSLGLLVPDSLWSPGKEVPLTELHAAISSKIPFFFPFSCTNRNEVRTGRLAYS